MYSYALQASKNNINENDKKIFDITTLANELIMLGIYDGFYYINICSENYF